MRFERKATWTREQVPHSAALLQHGTPSQGRTQPAQASPPAHHLRTRVPKVPNCRMSNFFHFQEGWHTLRFCQPQQEMTLRAPSPPGTNSAGSPRQQLPGLVPANSLAPSAPFPWTRTLESTAAAPVGTPAELGMWSVRGLHPWQCAPARQSEFPKYSFQADCEDCGHHRLDKLLVN